MGKLAPVVVFIGCLCIGNAWAQSTPSAPVVVTITATPVSAVKGYAIPQNFSGLSFERGTLNFNNAGVNGYLFSPLDVQLVTLFQNLGIHNLRVGGGSVDDEVPVGYGPDGYSGIDNLFNFAQVAGVKVIYTFRLLNTRKAYPDLKTMDANVANYIWRRYSGQVDNFALGNEPDFHSYHTYCTNSECTCSYPTGCVGPPSSIRLEDPAIYETETSRNTTAGTAYPSYLADWQKYAYAILDVVPSARFSAPDTGAYNTLTYTPTSASGVSWTQQFAEDEANATNGIGRPLLAEATQHFYVGGSPGKTTATQAIDNMLSRNWVTDTEISSGPEGSSTYTPYRWLYANNLEPVLAAHVPYRLTESNDYLTGIPGASNGYASALWALDYMHWWAEHRASGVNFHNKQWIYTDTIVPNPYPCVAICGNFQAVPKAYGIKAFDLGGHGYVEPVAIVNPDNINLTAYAVGEGQDLYVTLINKTHNSTHDSADAIVTIHPKGFTAASCASMLLTDGDPGNAALMTGTLGGARIANNARWLGKWTPMKPDTTGSCTSTVPATTAEVVRIRAASSYEGPVQINQNGTLEVFGIGGNGDIWQDTQVAADIPDSSESHWTGWADLPGGIQATGRPAVVKNLNNTLQIFIPGTGGDVYFSRQNSPGGSWSNWTDMGSSSDGMSDLEAANNADGSVTVFGIGLNGDIWYAAESAPGVGWSEWTDLTGENIRPGYVIGRNLNGLLDVFGVDSRGTVWENCQTDSNLWSGWMPLTGNPDNRTNITSAGFEGGGNPDLGAGERFDSQLAVGRNLDGRLEVLGIGADSHIWFISQDAPGGKWGHWQDLGGIKVAPGFAVGQDADGRLEIFGVAAAGPWGGWSDSGQSTRWGSVWTIEQQMPDGRWGDWTNLGEANVNPHLVVGNTADGRIQLFAVGSNHEVWSNWQQANMDNWDGWQDFSGKGIRFY